MRQQHRRNVTTRANYSESKRFFSSIRWRSELHPSDDFAIRIVVEQHAKIRFARVSGNQRVRTFGVFDAKTMRSQSFDVDSLAGDEFEKAFDVSFLRPAYVRQRLMV